MNTPCLTVSELIQKWLHPLWHHLNLFRSEYSLSYIIWTYSKVNSVFLPSSELIQNEQSPWHHPNLWKIVYSLSDIIWTYLKFNAVSLTLSEPNRKWIHSLCHLIIFKSESFVSYIIWMYSNWKKLLRRHPNLFQSESCLSVLHMNIFENECSLSYITRIYLKLKESCLTASTSIHNPVVRHWQFFLITSNCVCPPLFHNGVSKPHLNRFWRQAVRHSEQCHLHYSHVPTSALRRRLPLLYTLPYFIHTDSFYYVQLCGPDIVTGLVWSVSLRADWLIAELHPQSHRQFARPPPARVSPTLRPSYRSHVIAAAT